MPSEEFGHCLTLDATRASKEQGGCIRRRGVKMYAVSRVGALLAPATRVLPCRDREHTHQFSFAPVAGNVATLADVTRRELIFGRRRAITGADTTKVGSGKEVGAVATRSRERCRRRLGGSLPDHFVFFVRKFVRWIAIENHLVRRVRCDVPVHTPIHASGDVITTKRSSTH